MAHNKITQIRVIILRKTFNKHNPPTPRELLSNDQRAVGFGSTQLGRDASTRSELSDGGREAELEAWGSSDEGVGLRRLDERGSKPPGRGGWGGLGACWG